MIRHIFAEVWNTLRHYRLRAALTMLSVTWGVASLMLLLSYGHGFATALTQAWDQIGKDLIVIFPGQTSEQAGGERAGRRIRLEANDAALLRAGVPAIEAVSPELRWFLTVNHGYRTKDFSVAGVEASFERIRRTEPGVGRFFSEEDVAQRRRVAVLGADVKKELFSGRPALGEDIKIGGVRFSVIGVLKKKTQITRYEAPDDNTVFVPYPVLASQMDARYLNNLVVLPARNLFRNRIIPDIRAVLAREHRFSARDERAVAIRDWNEFRSIVVNLGLGLNILLSLVGSLTLSIGAVGVMNIMLVSVTERTREIGVLRALGARRREVLAQILLEGLTLTAAGGLTGFVFAAALTRAIGTLPLLGPMFDDTSGQNDIHLGISVSAVLASTIILIIVGLGASLIPAVRAARLDPAQAMRSD
jgi:putative ABC transport system permease protein